MHLLVTDSREDCRCIRSNIPIDSKEGDLQARGLFLVPSTVSNGSWLTASVAARLSQNETFSLSPLYPVAVEKVVQRLSRNLLKHKLTVDELQSVCGDNVRNREKDLSHVEGVGTEGECPSEGKDPVHVHNR